MLGTLLSAVDVAPAVAAAAEQASSSGGLSAEIQEQIECVVLFRIPVPFIDGGITFSVVGKALAVIILILQVAGSGGTFPIEVLPAPFKAIAPFLPFKYGINALREAVAGLDWGSYWHNLGMLLIFIVPALILGLLLRKQCIKIIAFFNEKIEESDLVI